MPHMLKICLVFAVAVHTSSASAQTVSAHASTPALTTAQIDAATIGHDGGINGFNTSALRVSSAHVYVVVLRNTDSGTTNPGTGTKKLLALAVGKPYVEHAPVTLDAKALDAMWAPIN